MGKMVSQEYLANLEIDQLNELQTILSDAESAIDAMEDCKSRIESSISEGEGSIDEMQDLADFTDGELIGMLQDAVSEGTSLAESADELRDYFLNFDADEYLDQIQNLVNTSYAAWDWLWETTEVYMDTLADIEENCLYLGEIAVEEYNDSIDYYDSALAAWSEMEPYMWW